MQWNDFEVCIQAEFKIQIIDGQKEKKILYNLQIKG